MPVATTLSRETSRRILPRVALLGATALAVSTGVASADELVVPELIVSGVDAGVPLELIGGLSFDSTHSQIVIGETGRNRVLVFDGEGNLLHQFIHRVVVSGGKPTPGRPGAMAFNRDGNLLLADGLVPYVDIVDLRGKLIDRIVLPAPDDGAQPGHGAGVVSVAPDGTVLVGARGDSGRVYMFSPTLELLASWGEPGLAPGKLSGITGLAMAPDGRIVVACSRTELSVQVFDSKGGYIQGFGRHDIGPGNFSYPSGLIVTADGRIWVLDEIRHDVQVFDSAGSLLGVVGGLGSGPGEFGYPNALASDGLRKLLVAERVGKRVQVLRIQ